MDVKIRHKLIEIEDRVSDRFVILITNEPRCEKTGLRGFRPGPTQSRLYSHRR